MKLDGYKTADIETPLEIMPASLEISKHARKAAMDIKMRSGPTAAQIEYDVQLAINSSREQDKRLIKHLSLESEDNERWQKEVLADFKIEFDDHTQGRRLAFTQWMADRLQDKKRIEELEKQIAEEKKWKEEDPRMLREQIRVADIAFNHQLIEKAHLEKQILELQEHLQWGINEKVEGPFFHEDEHGPDSWLNSSRKLLTDAQRELDKTK